MKERGPSHPAVAATYPPETRSRPWRGLGSAGESAWVLPALLALAILAGVAYGWGMASQVVEVYYAATVRSMTLSWHNFLFAAFDPDATISLDKLPGALWLQVASVKVFGWHVWALILPQVIEGALAVLLLFRAVRRLAGPIAGIVAAAVLACLPATVALNRGNISDSLLIMLLLCAVDATMRALVTGRAGSLLLAGLWIGLAFQAKMLEAWLLVPGLALAWLVAGSGSMRGRLAAVAGLCVVTIVVSLAWITAVSLVPQQDRPYVDGSQHDSLFEQVFDYNGFGRVGQQPASQTTALIGGLLGVTLDSASVLDRTVSGPGGRDIGWLLPAALLAGAATLVLRRDRPRTDLARAGVLVFGAWLLADIVLVAVSRSLNAYYLAALAPPVAALIGIACATVQETRAGRERLLLSALALATVAYEAWLLVPAVAVIRVAVPLSAVALIALGRLAPGRGRVGAALTCSLLAILVAPAVASASLVVRGWGPFDTPFEPAATTALTQRLPVVADRLVAASLGRIEAAKGTARYMAATYTSLLAAPFIVQSGQEVLPIGGFTGTIPVPTLSQLRAAVARGDVHLVISPASHDPRIAWVASHCFPLPGGSLPAYFCLPGSL